MTKKFLISPSEKQRLQVVLEGRLPDETENEYVRRVNAVLTPNDRQLLVDIMDARTL